MKAASIKSKGQIQIEEIPKPEVLPGTLLMKVIYCSICGSDVERVYSPLWDIASEEQEEARRNSVGGEPV